MAGQLTHSSRLSVPPLEQQARARWTMELSKILVDLIVEQVQKGNRRKNTLGKKEWRYVRDEFYQKTGLRWDKEQLKNRYSVLRRQYVTVKSILARDDFRWDETTGIIIATEDVWAGYIRSSSQYIFSHYYGVGVLPKSGRVDFYPTNFLQLSLEPTKQEHPDAEPIKTCGCPMYKELSIIFSEPRTNEKSDHSSARETCFLLPCSEPLRMEVEASSSESDEVDEVAGGRETVQPTIPSSCSRKRGRKGKEDSIAGAILEMAAASKLRTAAAQQRNARYTIADCIKELDEMQGLEEQVYFAALDLFNTPNARETFLSLKRDKRFIWLRGKCTAPSSS